MSRILLPLVLAFTMACPPPTPPDQPSPKTAAPDRGLQKALEQSATGGLEVRSIQERRETEPKLTFEQKPVSLIEKDWLKDP